MVKATPSVGTIDDNTLTAYFASTSASFHIFYALSFQKYSLLTFAVESEDGLKNESEKDRNEKM